MPRRLRADGGEASGEHTEEALARGAFTDARGGAQGMQQPLGGGVQDEAELIGHRARAAHSGCRSASRCGLWPVAADPAGDALDDGANLAAVRCLTGRRMTATGLPVAAP